MAGLLVGAVAAPAQAQTVLDRHVDVLDIDYTGGGMDVNVRAYADTGAPGRYGPAAVAIEVRSSMVTPTGRSTTPVPTR